MAGVPPPHAWRHTHTRNAQKMQRQYHFHLLALAIFPLREIQHHTILFNVPFPFCLSQVLPQACLLFWMCVCVCVWSKADLCRGEEDRLLPFQAVTIISSTPSCSNTHTYIHTQKQSATASHQDSTSRTPFLPICPPT